MNAELWDQFRYSLSQQIHPSFESYLEHLECRQMTETHWDLTLPDAATCSRVETMLADKIREIASDVAGHAVTISFNYEGAPEIESRQPALKNLPFAGREDFRSVSNLEESTAAFVSSPTWKRPAQIVEAEQSNLNPNFTFDTFVYGKSNDLAYSAAQAVAEAPGIKYPLLYLYGGVGLGKTHLMQAIGNQLQRKNLRVRYITTEDFCNELVAAIRDKGTVAFRERMRKNCDVLLLDDIQFLAGREQTMEEFFHTFNALQSAHKQVVMTSDKCPEEIKGLDERLRSRFGGDLIADIQLPDFETRMAILNKKASREGVYLPRDVCEYIASKVTSNIRELEGYLKRIIAVSECRNERISRQMAVQLIEPLIRTQHVQINIDAIIERVCKYYGVSREDVMGKSRKAQFCRPRQIIQFIAYEHTGLSYPEIAKIFDRDHTSVMNSCDRIKKERASNSAFDYEVKKLEEDLLR